LDYLHGVRKISHKTLINSLINISITLKN